MWVWGPGSGREWKKKDDEEKYDEQFTNSIPTSEPSKALQEGKRTATVAARSTTRRCDAPDGFEVF